MSNEVGICGGYHDQVCPFAKEDLERHSKGAEHGTIAVGSRYYGNEL